MMTISTFRAPSVTASWRRRSSAPPAHQPTCCSGRSCISGSSSSGGNNNDSTTTSSASSSTTTTTTVVCNISSVFDDVLAHRSHPEWDRLLFACCHRNNVGEVQRLLVDEGIDPSHANPVGQSALHVAAWYGHFETVNVLLQHGAKVDAANALTGATPLHCCLQHNHNRRPADNNNNNITCAKLLRAAQRNDRHCRLECVRLLVRAGAAWDATDMMGKTPLDYYSEEAGEEAANDLVLFV